MKKIKQLIIVAMFALGFGLLAPVPVGAASVIDAQCAQNKDSAVCKDKNATPESFIATVINVLLFLVGAISVLMIIIGGILYAVSAGDAGAVTRAKHTVTYAVVGLVVSFVAYAIVNFVIKQLI